MKKLFYSVAFAVGLTATSLVTFAAEDSTSSNVEKTATSLVTVATEVLGSGVTSVAESVYKKQLEDKKLELMGLNVKLGQLGKEESKIGNENQEMHEDILLNSQPTINKLKYELKADIKKLKDLIQSLKEDDKKGKKDKKDKKDKKGNETIKQINALINEIQRKIERIKELEKVSAITEKEKQAVVDMLRKQAELYVKRDNLTAQIMIENSKNHRLEVERRLAVLNKDILKEITVVDSLIAMKKTVVNLTQQRLDVRKEIFNLLKTTTIFLQDN